MIGDDLRAARQVLIDAGMTEGEADELVSLAEREIPPSGPGRTPYSEPTTFRGERDMGATYQKRGQKSWRVTVHWKGEREIKTVHSEQDAKALVQYIHKQELAGINVIEAIRKARGAAAPEAPTYPRLRDALPTWIEAQESAGAIRPSTSRMYRSRCERCSTRTRSRMGVTSAICPSTSSRGRCWAR